MSKRALSLIVLTLAALLVLAACGGQATKAPAAVTKAPATQTPATATQAPAATKAPTLSGNPIRGGVLYDNWIEALGVEAPEGDQPLWKTQTTNTRTGADTWRCKECHGWDYKGVEGAYGSGSHKTGFKGIFASASLSEADIIAWLNGTKNPDHNFSAYFKDPQYKMLAAFIKGGMADMSAFINKDKTIKGGNLAHGKELYNGVCKVCHGEDGKAIAFGDDKANPQYVGTIASDNPWEFWHKTSVGQPGKAMAAGLNLDWKPQDFADLLTYAQTLPTK